MLRLDLTGVVLGSRPPWQAATRSQNAPAEGEQRMLELGEQPSDRIYAKKEEKQADKKEHVVEGTHSHLAAGSQQGGKII